jgi:hypothetical protein
MSSEKSALGTALRIVAVCTAALIAACGDLSDVGKQENDSSPPFADAVVLNQPFSKDASGNVTVRVRSGAEVLLSGKDSDGTVAPVLRFTWDLLTTGAIASQVHLVDRNNSTVSFKAPQVAQDTVLQFRLTVTDANDQTAQADVSVTVAAVPDPNTFLSYLNAPRRFTVSAVVDDATALETDVGFKVDIQSAASYIDLRGIPRTVQLPVQTLMGQWLKSEGAGEQCGDYQNPQFSVDLPRLDVNQIAALVRADSQRAATEVPDLSKMDEAGVVVTFTISETGEPGFLPAGRSALVCVTNAQQQLLPDEDIMAVAGAQKPGGLLSSFSVDLDKLVGDPEGVAALTADTRASATAYYATIDDHTIGERKRSFLGWLKENGFVPATATSLRWEQLEAGSGAHALYVNNFDLGFGRDMYARRFDCTNPAVSPGECVASVVMNYASIEAAAKKLDPVVAVAMEYNTTPYSGGKKVVKFYTFAPNEVTGDFDRISSVDLDGRGEKFMPGACTICHGGTPQGLDQVEPDRYANGGDLNSSFLPWDLESFLYSDSPAAAWTPDADDTTDAALHGRYTKAAQQLAFRELNRLAYQTYVDDPARPGRYDLPRDLIHAWYGDAVDAPAFKEREVPEQWSAIDGPRQLYRDVFAQHCRMCHVAQVPKFIEQSGRYDPYDGCDASPPISQFGSTSPGQIAFGCYNQFIAAGNLISVLQRGVMPDARLTMDRLWVGGGTGDSAAKILATHLQLVTGRSDLLSASGQPIPPGRSNPVVKVNGIGVDDDAPVEVARFAPVRIDGAQSDQVATFTWDLCLVPIGATECVARSLVGGSSALPAFLAQESGDYRLTLTAGDGSGTSQTTTYTARVPNKVPEIAECPTEVRFANDSPGTIPLSSCIIKGDGTNTLQIKDPASGQWVDSVIGSAYTASVTGFDISFRHSAGATVPAALAYRVCDVDPDDCVGETIVVAIESTLATQPDTVTTHRSNPFAVTPTLPATITAAFLLQNDTVLPTNEDVTLSIVSPPASGNVSPTPIARDGAFAYTSTTVTCDINLLDINDGSSPCGDTFQYSMTSADGTNTSNVSTVRVRVQATTSFSQNGARASVYSSLGPVTCTNGSCHQSTGAGASRWTFTSNNASETLNSINAGGLINTATPSSSPFYRAPCDVNFAHTGMKPLNTTQCEVLLQWITEGAHLR